MSQSPGGLPPGYEWDEAKNQANIRKHGIDFRDAVRIFDKPTLDRVDSRQALRPILAELDERERTIVLLRFFGNMTQTQIAEKVGISQMHVSRLLAQTLDRLRNRMDPDTRVG